MVHEVVTWEPHWATGGRVTVLMSWVVEVVVVRRRYTCGGRIAGFVDTGQGGSLYVSPLSVEVLEHGVFLGTSLTSSGGFRRSYKSPLDRSWGFLLGYSGSFLGFRLSGSLWVF